jgi:hypothetical protein
LPLSRRRLLQCFENNFSLSVPSRDNRAIFGHRAKVSEIRHLRNLAARLPGGTKAVALSE